jgi:outer membrane protein insertion porin family
MTARSASDAEDASVLARAYGTVVDSVTVTGNTRTRTFAILREMQTQPGDLLEEKAIKRDIRYISDLSPIAEVTVTADSLSPGHTALRVRVVERSGWFMGTILPTLKYNFETGLTYGLRWKEKNFRGRLEQLTASYERNQRNDNHAALSWSSGWIGWRHISVGGQIRYFDRGKPWPHVTVLEDIGASAFIALPLTQSRMRFRQIEGSLSLDKSRSGAPLEETSKDVIVSPQLGYRFDSRDSRIKPAGGGTFFVSLAQSIPVDDSRNPFYRLRNQIRLFLGMSDRSVLALLSDVFYQFGDFPEFATVGLGGGRSLRGYPERRFIGYHRWFGTIEWRYMYLPRKVFRLPLVKRVDIGLGFVTFIDSGITWYDENDFDLDRLHGTAGVGIRFYSPIRDVLRLDFGVGLQGEARFNAGTGIRF